MNRRRVGKASMNKFLNNPQDKPFHSSAIARVAHGDTIGAASRETFSQRTHVNRNRKVVNHYRDSIIVRGGHGSPLANPGNKIDVVKPFNRDRRSIRALNNSDVPPISKKPHAASFVEPPARGYNPYK